MKLNIKEGITYLDDEYLKKYPKLRKISLPQSLTTLPFGAFYQMKHLIKVYIPSEIKLTKIPQSCFAYCNELTQLSIPNSVVTIEKDAFKETTKILEIEIPETVSFVDPDAFSGWQEHQIIYCHQSYEISQSCQAEIVLLHEMIEEESHMLEESNSKYFIVEAKCGHVGRHRYMPIQFAVQTTSKKDAARIVRTFPRVKHDHKDAIINVLEVSKEDYMKQSLINKQDPYLRITRKQDQNKIIHLIEDRLKPEPNYKRRKN